MQRCDSATGIAEKAGAAERNSNATNALMGGRRDAPREAVALDAKSQSRLIKLRVSAAPQSNQCNALRRTCEGSPDLPDIPCLMKPHHSKARLTQGVAPRPAVGAHHNFGASATYQGHTEARGGRVEIVLSVGRFADE